MIDFIKINSTNKVDFEDNIKNNIKDDIAIDLYCNANIILEKWFILVD